jgi:Cu/Ag efflux protein CusF
LTPGRFPRPALATIVLGLALGAAGCGGSGSTGAKEAEPAEPPDQTYTLRGEVAGLPRKSDGLRQIRVHHEPLPDFVGFEGDVVGMASMTMPFPLADSVDLDDVEEGDKVEMTFEVRWEGSPPLRVVALERLPADTPLDFESDETMPGEAAVDGAGSAPP